MLKKRDLLQLATRLIAQDKFGHISDANRPSTKTSMLISNGSSNSRVGQYPMLNKWKNIPFSNIANPIESMRKHKKSLLQAPPLYVLVIDTKFSWMRAIKLALNTIKKTQ